MIKKVMIAWAPVVLLLVAFGEPIFGFVLGEQWRLAGTISAVLAIQYMLMFCTTCISYCRVALDRQGVNFVMSLVNLGVTALGFAIGVFVFGDMFSTIVSYSVASCAVQILDMAINFKCLRNYCLKYLAFTALYIVSIGSVGIIIRVLMA